jgi:hypothetical protein
MALIQPRLEVRILPPLPTSVQLESAPQMSPLARFDVTPYYGQIEIRDPTARDYPQWETGEEKAVAIPGCIAVATRDDLRGTATIELRRGFRRLAVQRKRLPVARLSAVIHSRPS